MPLRASGFGDSPYGIEDLDIIGDHAFILGVPAEEDTRFKKRVFAAAKAQVMGGRSVDYVAKRYSSGWPDSNFVNPDLVPFRNCSEEIKSETRNVLTRVWSCQERWPDRPGAFAAAAALFRLQATIRGVILMIVNGFHHEAAALNRLALEQLAWIHSVHECEDTSYFESQPQKCIGRFSKAFPSVGRLYGALSETAHVVPEVSTRYIEIRDQQPHVYLGLPKWRAWDMGNLVRIADLYCQTAEMAFSGSLDELTHVEKIDGEYRGREERPLSGLAARFLEELRTADTGVEDSET